MAPTTTPFDTTTCRICGQDPRTPHKRVSDGKITECCVCTCHDEHVIRPSSHATFVAQARKGGIKGHGVGHGRKVCGRPFSDFVRRGLDTVSTACFNGDMATTHTILLPTGTKVRTATKRRYVVIFEDLTRPKVTGVEYRTDDLARAKAHLVKHGRTFRHIGDTTTGATV